jgi:cytoskeletal protein CcmA (bactofilin family)
MFNKKKSKPKNNRIDTLIGEDTHISGDIGFTGGLRVDGSITGNLQSGDTDKSILTLSSKGKIEGDVQVPHLIIDGTITGNVYAAEHIELAANAQITGNVYYNLLEMAMGAEVNGQMIHVRQQAATDYLDLQHEEETTTESFHLEQNTTNE